MRTRTIALPGLLMLALASPAAPAPPSPAFDAKAVLGPDPTEGERLLASRLMEGGKASRTEVDICLDLAWNPEEPQLLREAAGQRLRALDTRLVAESVISRLPVSPPAMKIGMLRLFLDLYRKMGGYHSALDEALSSQIRSPETEVASSAILVCSSVGVRSAYIPMREIATTPDSALRLDAIRGIARIQDPRAVIFFTKLLEEGDAAPREEIYRGLAQIGRPAALFLKSRLDDKDPKERLMAMDALLEIATIEDISSLYAYIRKYPPQGELKDRIYDKIATLEARVHERVPSD